MKREHSPCWALKTAALALACALAQSSSIAETVNIPDQSLEDFIRKTLHKPAGDITVADMESLTELVVGGGTAGISDLTGLENATNLTHLTVGRWTWVGVLGAFEGHDLSPLAGLINLTGLWLGGGEISDLSPLAGLTNLEHLALSDNQISDLSPLAGLTNLTSLRLYENEISDISPLFGLTNLTDLNIGYNYIDITPGSPARQFIDSLSIDEIFLVIEPQYEREPLIRGIPVGESENWYWCDWWGEYCTTFAPWLYHAEHGFLYRDPSSTNESMYVYDDAMSAWCWTSENSYPYIYAFNPPADNTGTDVESCWLFYFEDSKTPRVFGVVDGGNAGETLFFGP